VLERKSAMRSFLMRPEEMRRKARPPWSGLGKGLLELLDKIGDPVDGSRHDDGKERAEVRWGR